MWQMWRGYATNILCQELMAVHVAEADLRNLVSAPPFETRLTQRERYLSSQLGSSTAEPLVNESADQQTRICRLVSGRLLPLDMIIWLKNVIMQVHTLVSQNAGAQRCRGPADGLVTSNVRKQLIPFS